MPKLPLLVLGTHNRKKAVELVELLSPVGIEVQTLEAFPESIEVEETGTTFAENAALKASGQAKHLGQWVLGEDSGLVVGALNGAPGVYSARYSGPNATDESNNNLLLEQLGDTPLPQRIAHYVCHTALSNPAGEIVVKQESYCHGRIRFEGSGTAGFGYDPLFEIVEYHRTFGELGAKVKACLSHRSRAVRHIVPEIVRLLQAADRNE